MSQKDEALGRLLEMSEEDLLMALGLVLNAVASNRLENPTKAQLVKVAEKWLTSKRQEFAAAVCGNERCKELGMQDLANHERIILICVVADLVTDIADGLAPVTVAVVLVRQGLHHLCEEVWRREARGHQILPARIGAHSPQDINARAGKSVRAGNFHERALNRRKEPAAPAREHGRQRGKRERRPGKGRRLRGGG